jgi:drug/metabolite transporter (DMT)-like permease
MGHGEGGPRACSMASLLVFLGALASGTVCSLSSKAMLDIKAIGQSGEMESFRYPLFQATTMFLGMTAGLFFHCIVLSFQIPFPGYFHKAKKGSHAHAYSQLSFNGEFDEVVEPEMKPLPLSMYFLLMIPAIFDLVATCLCMYGLLFVSVSVYQMLRGSAIVFVAILKTVVLKDSLKRFQWVGIGLNVASIVLVGLTAMLIEQSEASASSASSASSADPAGGIRAYTHIHTYTHTHTH